MKTAKLKVICNQQVSKRYWHLSVDASGFDEEVKPGQFFNIRCTQAYNGLLRRPFSIFQIDKQKGTLEFLYLIKGLGTQRLTQLRTGELVDLLGPLGTGFTLPEDGGTILLLARGVGIATLTALAQEAAEKNIGVIAILSARKRSELLAVNTLEGFGTKVYTVTEEDRNSDIDHVRLMIEQIIHDHGIKAAYTCGSKRLSKLLQDITLEKKIPAEIALEENMACGIGVCLACTCKLKDSKGTVQTARVCKEGPVFSLSKVVFK